MAAVAGLYPVNIAPRLCRARGCVRVVVASWQGGRLEGTSSPVGLAAGDVSGAPGRGRGLHCFSGRP